MTVMVVVMVDPWHHMTVLFFTTAGRYRTSRNFGEKNIWRFKHLLHLARIKFDEMQWQPRAVPNNLPYTISVTSGFSIIEQVLNGVTRGGKLCSWISCLQRWPVTGDVLSCEMEDENLFDPYAVAMKKGSEMIGHIPRKISAAYFNFLDMGGTYFNFFDMGEWIWVEQYELYFPRCCDLIVVATSNALLMDFCAASISFTDRLDELEVPVVRLKYFHSAIIKTCFHTFP